MKGESFLHWSPRVRDHDSAAQCRESVSPYGHRRAANFGTVSLPAIGQAAGAARHARPSTVRSWHAGSLPPPRRRRGRAPARGPVAESEPRYHTDIPGIPAVGGPAPPGPAAWPTGPGPTAAGLTRVSYRKASPGHPESKL
eukprot:752950-Hanusia_phi.AAC.2